MNAYSSQQIIKLSRLKTPFVTSYPIPFIHRNRFAFTQLIKDKRVRLPSSLITSTRTAQATQKIPNSLPTREPVPYQNQGPHAPMTTPPIQPTNQPNSILKNCFYTTRPCHVTSWHGRGETFSYHYVSMLFVHKMMLVRLLFQLHAVFTVALTLTLTLTLTASLLPGLVYPSVLQGGSVLAAGLNSTARLPVGLVRVNLSSSSLSSSSSSKCVISSLFFSFV